MRLEILKYEMQLELMIYWDARYGFGIICWWTKPDLINASSGWGRKLFIGPKYSSSCLVCTHLTLVPVYNVKLNSSARTFITKLWIQGGYSYQREIH